MSDADWSGARFREALVAMVRKRVPASDVEDVVQAALTEALASKTRPEDPESLRKWIWGVARNKVADFHRRARRESLDEAPEASVEPAAHSERDLLRWATRSLPKGKDAEETLEWLLREGEGEKLESIAESANVPAPRVRKRVSRLRAHLRQHWAKEAAALAALGIILGLAIYFLRKKAPEPIAHDRPVPTVSPELREAKERAKEQRRIAFAACDRREWVVCLNGLNSARELDPEGDAAPEVGAARTQAEEEIRKELTPSPSALPIQKDQKDSVTPPPPVAPTGMTKPTKPVFNGKAKPPGKSDLGTPAGGDDGLGSKPSGVQKKAWDQRNGP